MNAKDFRLERFMDLHISGIISSDMILEAQHAYSTGTSVDTA